MRVFLDTEFIEDGKTIDLMSIGLVREDGKMYYAVSSECDLDKASDWVKENVIPNLFQDKAPFDKDSALKTRAQIKKDIVAFVGENPEFWAYYADYDWVVFCQLFGLMIDLPRNFPMFCLDFKQVLYLFKIERDSLNVTNALDHNALADAFELKQMYDAFLQIMYKEFRSNSSILVHSYLGNPHD